MPSKKKVREAADRRGSISKRLWRKLSANTGSTRFSVEIRVEEYENVQDTGQARRGRVTQTKEIVPVEDSFGQLIEYLTTRRIDYDPNDRSHSLRADLTEREIKAVARMPYTRSVDSIE